jgi:Domain of unknown function (DUF4124)
MKRVLLFAALIIWSAVASAVVYKWSDADGKVHYGDRPPDGVKAEIVEGLGLTVHYSAQAAPATARAFAQPAAAAAAKDKPVDLSAIDAATAAREQQCATAQARLKQLTEGRHLFKPLPNGEREYLTSDQIDAERLDAKKEVDTVCGRSN